jgi:hypothetical protein
MADANFNTTCMSHGKCVWVIHLNINIEREVTD